MSPLRRDALALIAIVAAAVFYLAKSLGNAWDYDTFHYAAVAFRRGLDPYGLGVLSGVAGKQVVFPFLYPPGALALFIPLTWVPLATAEWIWLGIKIVMAVALIVVWRSRFARGARFSTLLVVAIFGFNAAMLWDLETGNVSIVEQLLLWSGFACLLSGKRWAFALLVALSSIFKLLPIVFLGLLFLPSFLPQRRLGPLLAGLALFAAIVALPSVLGLDWARGFHIHALADRPFGETNPGALGLFDSLLGPGWWAGGTWASGRGARHPLPGIPDIAIWLWLLYAIALLVVSRRALARTWREGDPMKTIVIACFALTLVSPRMMVYSFILLAAPALILFRGMFHSPRARAIGVSLIVLQGLAHWLQRVGDIRLPPGPYPVALAWMNLSFLLALALWAEWIRRDGVWSPDLPQREAAHT